MFIWLCQVLVTVCGIFSLCCSTQALSVAACGIQFLDQGSNLGPLHWECRLSHWTTMEVLRQCCKEIVSLVMMRYIMGKGKRKCLPIVCLSEHLAFQEFHSSQHRSNFFLIHCKNNVITFNIIIKWEKYNYTTLPQNHFQFFIFHFWSLTIKLYFHNVEI